MKKKSHMLRNFFVLVLLGVLIYLGYYVYNETDVFIIKDVSILGNIRIPDDEIIDYLLDDELHYFKMNTYELNEKLERYSKVKDCLVKKVFPDRLEITLSERLPVIEIAYSGMFLLVDEEFVVVEVSNVSQGYYLIEGYKFDDFNSGYEIQHEDRYILEHAMDLAFLVMNYDGFDRPPIVIKNNEIRLYITDRLVADFGDGKNTEERFNKMCTIYEEATTIGLDSGIINVSHDGYPGIRPFEEY